MIWLWLGVLVGAQAAAPKPNILLICVDDLKPALGCYGDALARTPELDRLAGRAVLFERAYCNQAVCSPSRNALLTGLRPQTIGIYDLETNFRAGAPEAPTLPQWLQRAGYHAQSLGKIFHLGHNNFDDRASWSVPAWNPRAPQYALAENQRPKGQNGPPVECAEVPDETYADGQIASEAIARLRAAQQTPERPFFLAVGFLKPHLPFVAPKKYWDLHDPGKFELAAVREAPAGAPGYAPGNSGELRKYAGMPAKGPLAEADQRRLIHGYYAATSYVDAQIGRVLAELERLKLDSNTIVILWGDHGWHLGDHGQWCKHTNYEQATRIPLLVAAPQPLARAGARTRALVESVDLYPTLCELAGVEPPAGLDGRSFAAQLKDPAAPGRDHVIHVYPRNRPGTGQVLGRAIRTERYRLVEWKKPGAEPASAELELYDYQSDPLETRNLVAEAPEVVAQLRAMLATHPEARPQFSGPRPTAPGPARTKDAQE